MEQEFGNISSAAFRLHRQGIEEVEDLLEALLTMLRAWDSDERHPGSIGATAAAIRTA
jgi:hypothetical protein